MSDLPDVSPMGSLAKQLAGVDWRPIERVKVVGHESYATHEGFIQMAGHSIGVFKLNNGQSVYNTVDVADFFGLTVEEIEEMARL